MLIKNIHFYLWLTLSFVICRLTAGIGNLNHGFYIFFLYLFFTSLSVKSQQFETTSGMIIGEGIGQVKQTSTGYAMISTTVNYDICLVNMNRCGNNIMTKLYSAPGDDVPANIVPVAGGYVIGGSTDSYGAGDLDLFIMKVDLSGNILWQKTYGGTEYDEVYYGPTHNNILIQTNDGGFAMVGFTYSYGSNPTTSLDGYLIKTDVNGNLSWAHTYGTGSEDDLLCSVVQTSSGEYFLTGETDDGIFCVKTDASGNIVWSKEYSIPGYSYVGGSNGIETSGGGFIIASHGMSSSFKGAILKLDANGNVSWTKEYYATNSSGLNSIIQTTTGDYVAVGEMRPFNGSIANSMLKIDNSGNLLWSYNYGVTTNGYSYAVTIEETINGGFALAGWLGSGTNQAQAFVAVTDSDGETTCQIPLALTVANLTATGNDYGTSTVGGLQNNCGFTITAPSNAGNVTCNTSSSISAMTSSTNTLCYGQCTGITTVNPINGNPPYTYFWNPTVSGQTSQTVTGLCPGIYTVTVTDATCDFATTTVTITQPTALTAGELFLPNAFSPNGDGENDFLKIYYSNMICIKTFALVIYDRWGEKIFETTDLDFTWDGKYGSTSLLTETDKIMNTSVFVYYLQTTMIDGKEIVKKGNISLIR